MKRTSLICTAALLMVASNADGFLGSLSSVSSTQGVALASAGAASTVAVSRKVAQHHHANKALIKLSAEQDPVLPATAPIAVLMCHGFGASGAASAKAYQSTIIKNNVKIYAVDFPSSVATGQHPLFNAHFAQEANIERIIQMYVKMVKDGYRVILWGFSDGAASVITAMGTYDLNNIVAVVARSPYSALENVTTDLARNALSSTSLPTSVANVSAGSIGHTAASAAGTIAPYSYVRGVRPIDVVHKINKPIVFVASSKDELVRPARTQELAEKLQAERAQQQEAPIVLSALLRVPVRGGHNDFFVEPMLFKYKAVVKEFLADLGIHGVIKN